MKFTERPDPHGNDFETFIQNEVNSVETEIHAYFQYEKEAAVMQEKVRKVALYGGAISLSAGLIIDHALNGPSAASIIFGEVGAISAGLGIIFTAFKRYQSQI